MNKVCRAKAIFLLFLSIMVLDACSYGLTQENYSISDENSSEVIASGEQEDANGIDISMEEAIQIAEQEADQYYEDLKLTEIHSYDNDISPDINAGVDGKREWWYVNFANEKLNYVNVLIQDGEVCVVHTSDENGNNGLFELEEVQMTSADAVQKAKEMGLKGGNPDSEEEWVSGYNFKVAYGSLVECPDDKRIFFEVIGVSPDGNFAHVDFDAVTGELLLAEEEIEYENGETEWIELKME